MPLRRAFGNALGGAADFGGELLRQQIANEAAVRNDQLERARTADALIASGKLHPEDRLPYITGRYQGPSVQDRLSGILTGLKSDPNVTLPTLGTELEKEQIPTRGFGPQPSSYTPMGMPNFPKGDVAASAQSSPSSIFMDETGKPIPPTNVDTGEPVKPVRYPLQPPLPSAPSGPVLSPAMLQATAQRQASIPHQVMGKGETAEGAPTETYGQRSPDSGQLVPDQTATMGSTNAQKATTAKATAQGTKTGEETGSFLTRDWQKQVAQDVAIGTEQGRLSTENAPPNVAGSANRAATIAGASAAASETSKAQAQINFIKTFTAGGGNEEIGKQLANTYIRESAGRPYAFVDPSTPMAEKGPAIASLSASGIKVVNDKQRQALEAINTAISSYKADLSEIDAALATSAAGRPLNILNNTIGSYAQTNPQLKAYLSTRFPQQIADLKAITGTIGRLMSVEITGTADLLPGPNDTRRTAYNKLRQYGQQLGFQQDSILGKAH